MVRQLDHLDEGVVHGFGRDHHAGVLDLSAIAIVEFVTMAMTFGNHILAVNRVCQGAMLEPAFLQAKTHAATKIGVLAAMLDITRSGAPLGDQANHRMPAMALVLGGIGAGKIGEISRNVHHRCLHAVADAEIRDALFACVLRGHHLAFETAVTETTGHQDRIDTGEHADTFGLDLLGLQPLQPNLGALAHAAVAQGFTQRFVGVLMIDVLADHGDSDFIDRMLNRIDHRFPIGKIERPHFGFQTQALNHDLIQTLLMQPQRQLVDVVHVDAADDGFFMHVGEQCDLASFAIR